MTTYARARSTAEISSSNLKQIVNEQVENSNLGGRWFTAKQRCNTDKSHIIPASTSGSAEIRSMESPLRVRPYSSSEVQSRFKQLRVHNKLLTTYQTQSSKGLGITTPYNANKKRSKNVWYRKSRFSRAYLGLKKRRLGLLELRFAFVSFPVSFLEY